jgi:hypothetical protein
MKIPKKDGVDVDKYQEKIWVVSAHNVPADSNIEFSWGYPDKKAQAICLDWIITIKDDMKTLIPKRRRK